MSYSDRNGYGFCKECYKQKQFCICPNSQEEHCDQTFTEHNPSCQSIGEQEQQQQQQQGGLEQTQGPQTQDQIQEGQRQGPQVQEQQQGPQTQGNQTEDQDQIQGSQSQAQLEDQDQTQGPQLQAQRHGDQSMENNQTISTPVDVDGVTLNVKCGDCQPIIIPDFDFFKNHKNRNHFEKGGDDMGNCGCQECKKEKCSTDCNCCVQNLAEVLNGVRQIQASNPAGNRIDIYLSTLANPILNQIIMNVVDCSTLRFRLGPPTQTTVVPNTTVPLCDVAGICATNTSTDVFQYLLEQATNSPDDDTVDSTCKPKKKACCCPSCASGIGEELRCTANFGLRLDVFIRGQATPLSGYFVLAVKDCLVYLVNNITTPTRICVFSLCAITGFTVVAQVLGPTPTP